MKTAASYGLRGLMVLAVVFALSMMLMPRAFTQGKQDFTLLNRSGVAINELYVGPHSSDDWGQDILGIDTLPNGKNQDIVFDPKDKVARWDIQLIDENGKKHTQYDLNLMQISEITVRDNGDGTWHWSWK